MKNPFDALDTPSAPASPPAAAAPAKRGPSYNPLDIHDDDGGKGNRDAIGVGLAVAQGVTFGFGDEIEVKLRTLSSGDRGLALARIRDEQAAFAKENPKTALAGELAGGVLMLGAGGAKLIGGATLGGKVVRGGDVSMATGGLSGYGHNEQDDRLLTDVAVGAGLGTVVGGAVPLATAGASKLLGAAMPSRPAANDRSNDARRRAPSAR